MNAPSVEAFKRRLDKILPGLFLFTFTNYDNSIVIPPSTDGRVLLQCLETGSHSSENLSS